MDFISTQYDTIIEDGAVDRERLKSVKSEVDDVNS